MSIKKILLSAVALLAAISSAHGAATDSVTLNVKWKLGTTTGNKDSHTSFVIFNPNSGLYKYFDATALNKFKTDMVMPVVLPKDSGYVFGFCFSCNMAVSSSTTKYIASTDVTLQADTTIMFDPTAPLHRIGFKYFMPDGSPLQFVTTNGSNQDWSAATAYQAYFEKVIHLKGYPNYAFTVYTAVTGNSTSVGTDRSTAGDVYVNDNLGDHFSIESMVIINPVDKVTHLGDTASPGVIITLRAPGNVLDTVYSNNVADFKLLTPPLPRRSLYPASDAATQWTRKVNWVNTGTGAVLGMQSVGALYDNRGRVAYSVHPESSPLLLQLQKAETKKVRTACMEPGSGIAIPPYQLTADGVKKHYFYDNITQGYQTYMGDENGIIRMYPDNAFYAYSPHEQQPDFGNTAPMMTFSMSWRTASGTYLTPYPTTFTNGEWLGNGGERRCVDLFGAQTTVTAGTDTLATEWAKIVSGLSAFAKTQHDPAVITIDFDNRNFMVDSLQGRSHAIFQYNDGASDINPPSLQMLQYRTPQGQITTKFDNFDDALLYFHAADLNYTTNPVCVYFAYSQPSVKVEVSKHDRDEWFTLQHEQQPELFMMPVWGAGYKVALNQYPRQKNDHYYDLRITLTDAAGNKSQQTLTPSFFVKGDPVAGADEHIASPLSINMEGNLLYVKGATQPIITIYSASGSLINTINADMTDISTLTPGIYIVRAYDGPHSANAKIIRR